jgi:hypothetical protein
MSPSKIKKVYDFLSTSDEIKSYIDNKKRDAEKQRIDLLKETEFYKKNNIDNHETILLYQKYPCLKDCVDKLWNQLNNNDIIGLWLNAIVIKGLWKTVYKILFKKNDVDDLREEFYNHQKFYNCIELGRKNTINILYQDNALYIVNNDWKSEKLLNCPEETLQKCGYNIDELKKWIKRNRINNVAVPEVIRFNENPPFMSMKYIDWSNLGSFFWKDVGLKKLDLPLWEEAKNLSDRNFDNYLKKRTGLSWLSILWQELTMINNSLSNLWLPIGSKSTDIAKYTLATLSTPYANKFLDLLLAEKRLSQNWLQHRDLHTGNILIW